MRRVMESPAPNDEKMHVRVGKFNLSELCPPFGSPLGASLHGCCCLRYGCSVRFPIGWTY